MMSEETKHTPTSWSDEPEFQIGDVVEITEYPEWAGEHYLISSVERLISSSEDRGRYEYETWREGEGSTTGWQAGHLRLVKRRACNAHDELVALVQSDRDSLVQRGLHPQDPLVKKYDALLAKARNGA